jgi:hypothetical protein
LATEPAVVPFGSKYQGPLAVAETSDEFALSP